MTNTSNVFNDPQGSIAVLLRPPDGFEALYQGAPRETPLAFVQADQQHRFLPLDPRAGQAENSEFLLRYVPVPIAATFLLYIPRALYVASDTPSESAYTYELRWRLRSTIDHNVAQEHNNPGVPYSLIPKRGAPEDDGTNRYTIPATTSEVILPTAVGSSELPLVAAGQTGVANQGIYVPASVGGGDVAYEPNAYFPPIARRVLGNELSIVAYRAAGETWDFSAADAGMSNVYGTNMVAGGTRHPVFPGVGMYLVFLAGSPAL